MVSCRTLPGSRASSRQAATRSLKPSWVSRALTSTRPPSVLACGWSKRATTGFANPSPWKVTWVIQSVAIEPPCDGVLKRLDTAFIAPARGSVALLFHRSRIFQVRGMGPSETRQRFAGEPWARPGRHSLRRGGLHARPLGPARPRLIKLRKSGLAADANPVDELRGALFGDGDREAQRVGLGFVERVGGVQHLPVAGHRLDHRHRLVLLFVVAQRDLPLDLPQARAELAPVLLRALADHVEGLAQLDLHALVLGRVVDPVLADELLAACRIGLVDAHLALGQWQAQPAVHRRGLDRP